VFFRHWQTLIVEGNGVEVGVPTERDFMVGVCLLEAVGCTHELERGACGVEKLAFSYLDRVALARCPFSWLGSLTRVGRQTTYGSIAGTVHDASERPSPMPRCL